jgi:glycosyltransferase involved in cell wall biosynthesis
MEQFFPYLEQCGFSCDYSWFINEGDDSVFYSSGKWLSKLGIFFKAASVRWKDVLRANMYDVIFVQREAFMTGSVFFEKRFSKSNAKLIFDFDDAIWNEDTSVSNQKLKWLKRPSKTADIIKLADVVIAGSSYLADYTKQFNTSVQIIPTTVDTTIYLPSTKNYSSQEKICIGWSGSKTTIKHFALLVPVLKMLDEKYGNRIYFKQIGDRNFSADGLKIECDDWHFENEVEELNKIDIGLMPLPDDEWAKGKCAFKAIQYMALEIPAVISPVGMNNEVLKENVSGFFASSNDEWLIKISALIDDFELRRRIGIEARKRVIENYSIHSQIQKMIQILASPKR